MSASEALRRDATVAVIGAGAMGAGIAQIAAANGHVVQLHDTRFGAADAAKAAMAATFDKLVEKGRMQRADADATLARVQTVVTRPDVCVADLIVEAIVEDLAVKRELFEALENVVAPECIIASNTSSISITALAAGMKHPERFVGMHFFNPAPLMPLVEVVHGLATSREVADAIQATAAQWGKTPVHATSTPGFIVNRCARPFYSEGLRLLGEGAATPATLDAIYRDAGGFRMGPFELMDLIGLDVNLAVTRGVWEAYFNDPRYTPSVIQQELVAAGFHGRKSGRGFYRYDAGAQKPAPAQEPSSSPPRSWIVHGEPGALAPLLARMERGGARIERAAPHAQLGNEVLSVARDDATATIALTDGRTATQRAIESGVPALVALDCALDFGTCTRVAIACADTCPDAARIAAVGALQAAGVAVSRIDDVAGLVVLRTLAMLVNEAADAVTQGVAEPAAIDLAMKKGVNYPRGPFEWGRELGIGRIAMALSNLARHYGEPRYRTSPLVARRALTGLPLDG